MRPQQVTQTGAGNSNPVLLSQQTPTFQVSLGTDVTGTVDYTIQYTFDPRFDPAPNDANSTIALLAAIADATWYDHADLTAKTAAAAAVLINPATAVRIKQNSGAGVTKLYVLQAGKAMAGSH